MRVRYGAGYFRPVLDDEGYWDDADETSDSEAGLELVKSPPAKRRRCLLNLQFREYKITLKYTPKRY